MTCRVLDRDGSLVAGNLQPENALRLMNRVARATKVVREDGVTLAVKQDFSWVGLMRMAFDQPGAPQGSL